MADEGKEGRRRDNIWRPYLEDSSNKVPGTDQASTAQGINSSHLQLQPPETHEAARPLVTTTGGSSRTSVPGTSSATIQQQNASHPKGMGEGSNLEHGSEADEEPRNACTFGEEAFRCAEELEKCTRENINKRKHLCHACSKRFAFPSQLQRHYRTHTGEKPYTCKVCQRKFAHEWHLERHQKSHGGEEPFFCDRCGVKYTRKETLTKHVNQRHPRDPERDTRDQK